MSRRWIFIASLACALLFMALNTAPSIRQPSVANAQSDLSARVADLETQVADLTARIDQLEAIINGAPTTTSTQRPTPTASPGSTTAGPTANLNANLRSGPGTTYSIAGSTEQGQSLKIVACNPACDWYQLANGTWIAAFLVDNPPVNVPRASVGEAITTSSAPEQIASPPTPTPQPPTPVTQAPTEVCKCTGNLYNCSDFSTQADAQACYAYCVDQGAGNIHRLDGNDNDGLACESLP